MKKDGITLVVLAAGMGSRFGGLKQIVSLLLIILYMMLLRLDLLK